MPVEKSEIGLDPRKKLTYSELLGVLCILAVRFERLENLVLEMAENYLSFSNYITAESIRTQVELIRHKNKDMSFKRFTSRRIKQVEENLQGFISFYHEDVKKKPKAKPKQPYTGMKKE